MVMGFNILLKNMKLNKMTEISEERYEYLIERDAWLEALEQAGVDNWEGYDEALEIYKENNAK